MLLAGTAAAVEPDGRPSWSGRGVALDAGHRDQVVAVLDRVRELCGGPELPVADPAGDYPTAHAALEASWELVIDALRSALRAGPASAAPTGAPRYLALLDEIKRADHELLLGRIRYRDAAFNGVQDALAALRQAETTSALIERATEVTCTLGFDRAILSRVEDSSWIPEHVSVGRDQRWAREILQVARAAPVVLDRTVVETEMVRRKVSILVDNVQERPAVNRAIAEASGSRCYVAAPLLASGQVVGFLHADAYYQQRDLDEFDRQLLTTFAEGLGHALGRTVLMDRLAAIRVGFDQVAGALAAARDDQVRLGPAGRGALTLTDGWPPGGPGQPLGPVGELAEDAAKLTRREAEVLRLMAAGDTNARIARRLAISEGTVKSHVKHILRKLDAANRAEAVSRWLGMQRVPGGHEVADRRM